MSETVRCDCCGAVADTEGLIGWFHVERIGIDVRTFEERDKFDVCSSSCGARLVTGGCRVAS